MSVSNSNLAASLSALASFPFADLSAAIAAGGANAPDDLAVAEDIAGAAATLGVPFAGDVDIALEALGFVLPLLPASTASADDEVGVKPATVGR